VPGGRRERKQEAGSPKVIEGMWKTARKKGGKERTPLDEPAPSDEALSRSTVSRTVCLKSGLPVAGPPASGALAAPAAVAAAGPADADRDADEG
jgi:hypothetical protein